MRILVNLPLFDGNENLLMLYKLFVNVSLHDGHDGDDYIDVDVDDGEDDDEEEDEEVDD